MPPPRTAVGQLAEAIRRLERRPFPARLDFIYPLFCRYGRRLPFGLRLVFGNLWLFAPLVKGRLKRVPGLNAAMRTTIAPTRLGAGIKENVLPATATATVNLRLFPGETTGTAADRVRQTLRGLAVTVREVPGGFDPTPVAGIDSPSFSLLARTIGEVFPEAVVAPSLVVGATDSRHYVRMAESVLRFTPLRLTPGDLKRIHGTDERVDIADYHRMIDFYCRLLGNLQGL